MKCKHCFVDKETKDDYFSMNYKEIIDYLYGKGLFILYYTYGEPLLCDNLFEIAKYVSEKGIYQVLMTNGYFINSEQIVNRIIDCGIKRIYISIDSIDSNKHDSNRGRNGAWEQAINAIRLLSSYNISIGMACTLTNDNYEEIIGLYDLAINNNVSYISFLRCRENGKVVQFANYLKYINGIREAIIRSKRDHIEISFHDVELISLLNEMRNEGTIDEAEFQKYSSMCRCHKKENINIAPNGDIYSCDFSQYVIGNGYLENLEKIIERKDTHCSCIKEI